MAEMHQQQRRPQKGIMREQKGEQDTPCCVVDEVVGQTRETAKGRDFNTLKLEPLQGRQKCSQRTAC